MTAKAQITGEGSPRPTEAVERAVYSEAMGLSGAEGAHTAQAANKRVLYASENDTDAERIVARTEDEASILKVMRRRGMALKTKRSYVGAYRNFVQQTGVTRGAAIEARHLKSYLDCWRMA